MKKLLVALLVGCAGLANADLTQTAIVRSSYTATADTQQVLLTTGGVGAVGAPGYLTAIVLNQGNVGWISIFGSSWTTTPLIASMTTNTASNGPASIDFHDTVAHGLSYTKTGTSQITILYRKQ